MIRSSVWVCTILLLVGHAFHMFAQQEPASTATIGGSGTTNYIPIWKSATNLGNSTLFQAKGDIGIATTHPVATLDVNGSTILRGGLGVYGSTTLRGGLTVFGFINNALRLQGNVTDPCSGLTSANLIGGWSANAVAIDVTGATIGGGGETADGTNPGENLVTGDFGTVGGGAANHAGDNSGTTCDAPFATVGGGLENQAIGYSSTVGGGFNNQATGNSSTVGGGSSNHANGDDSTVPGGLNNISFGDKSFAAGQFAVASDPGSFVWCQTGAQCNSLGANSFTVSVLGPIYFFDGPGGSGCNLSAGGGSWNCSSDRNLKDDIVPIDSRSVLERVAQLPITQWKMKTEPAGRKHIGPMAQDFHAAFGLGDDERYITLGDGQGVALAAIQALYQVVKEKDGQIQKLNTQLQELRNAQSREVTELEERLIRVEAQFRMVRTESMANEARGAAQTKLRLELPSQPAPRLTSQKESNEIELQTFR